MLHREEAGFGPAGGVDLGVDVLDVVARGLRRDDQAPGDLLVGQAAGQEPEHLDLACGQPGGSSRRRPIRWPATSSTASTAAPSIRPARTSARSSAAALGGPGLAMRARLAHRLVGVSGAKDASRTRDRGSGKTAGVAGPVESLTMLHRDAAERRKRFGLVEHPLGEVRVEPYALPLTGGERRGLVPDGVRHTEAPEPVDEAGAKQRGVPRVAQPVLLPAGRPARRAPANARACRAT